MNKTHGMHHTKTYQAWEAMFQRVRTLRYIKRGIKICGRWRKFENFYADMGACPRNLTLDRINNNRGYTKANCRWTTMQEQAWNQSSTLKIFHAGRHWTVRDIAEKFNLGHHCVRWRMQEHPTWEYVTMPLSRGKRGMRELR